LKKIIVAETAGFCMGVRRAVNMVLELVEETHEPIYTIGPLIHNPQVVELLRQRGVIPVQRLSEIQKGTVVIRSHGVSPSIRRGLEEKRLRIIDATCPRVARVHRLVEQYAEQGALIIILGDPGHSEVEGILGFAGSNARVVQGPDEIPQLPEANSVLLVAQTTQSQKKFEETAEAVKKRYCELDTERVRIINTICDSTERRQAEVSELAKEAQAFVIVGGKESANTRRLQKLVQSSGLPAYLVESEDELDFEALLNVDKVGLTAGASTPNWMIRRVYEELHRRSLMTRWFPLRVFYQLLRFIGILNFYLGLGGALLTALVGILLSDKLNPYACFANFFYIFSIHNFNVLSSPRLLEVIEPARGKFFIRHRGPLVYLSLFGLVSGAVFAFLINPWALLFYAGLSILSLLYQAQFRPQTKRGIFRFRSLMDIPASKDLFSALAWSVMIVLLPIAPGAHFSLKVWLIFALIFLMVLARSIIQDFRDLQADRLAGKETIPTLLGADRSRILIHLLLSLAVLTLIIYFLLYNSSHLQALGLATGLLWLWLCVPLFTRRAVIQGLRAELMIDFSFILAGILGLLMSIF